MRSFALAQAAALSWAGQLQHMRSPSAGLATHSQGRCRVLESEFNQLPDSPRMVKRQHCQFLPLHQHSKPAISTYRRQPHSFRESASVAPNAMLLTFLQAQSVLARGICRLDPDSCNLASKLELS